MSKSRLERSSVDSPSVLRQADMVAETKVCRDSGRKSPFTEVHHLLLS